MTEDTRAPDGALPEDEADAVVQGRFWDEFDRGFRYHGPMTLLPARFFADGGRGREPAEAARLLNAMNRRKPVRPAGVSACLASMTAGRVRMLGIPDLREAVEARAPLPRHRTVLRIWLNEAWPECVEVGEEEGCYTWGELASAGRRCGIGRCRNAVTINRHAVWSRLGRRRKRQYAPGEWIRKVAADTAHLIPGVPPSRARIEEPEPGPEYWRAVGLEDAARAAEERRRAWSG